jgi:hypothetical protein
VLYRAQGNVLCVISAGSGLLGGTEKPPVIIDPATKRAYGPPEDGWPDRVIPQPAPRFIPRDPERPRPPARTVEARCEIIPGEWRRISYWWAYSADELERLMVYL